MKLLRYKYNLDAQKWIWELTEDDTVTSRGATHRYQDLEQIIDDHSLPPAKPLWYAPVLRLITVDTPCIWTQPRWKLVLTECLLWLTFGTSVGVGLWIF